MADAGRVWRRQENRQQIEMRQKMARPNKDDTYSVLPFSMAGRMLDTEYYGNDNEDDEDEEDDDRDGSGAVGDDYQNVGDEQQLSDGSTIKRLQLVVAGLTVWNNQITILEKNQGSGIRGVRIVSTNKPPQPTAMARRSARRQMAYRNNNNNNDNIVIASKRQSGLACVRRYESECQGMNSVINPNTTDRILYPSHEDDGGGNLIGADLVLLVCSSHRGIVLKYNCIVNVETSRVIKSWSLIKNNWDGGNVNTGRYSYDGTSSRPSFVPNLRRQRGGNCLMKSRDGTLEVFDMENQFQLINSQKENLNFSCDEGPTSGGNRGSRHSYGPINDAFYNSWATLEMLLDPEWGGLTRITRKGQLQVGVNYGLNYNNAFWNGEAVYLGSGGGGGNNQFYSFSTCIDVLAHEIAHSVTEIYSDLIYTGESGCLDESFSDIVGEMAKMKHEGRNDFCIAKNCKIQPTDEPCLRNLAQPVQYSDTFPNCKGVRNCQSPHHCSSIPNYIFYRLATAQGWTTQEAGQSWILANRFFWTREMTLKQAGCDVAAVVEHYSINGGDTWAVLDSWQSVGIDLSDCIFNPSRGDNQLDNNNEEEEDGNNQRKGRTPENAMKLRNCGSIKTISDHQTGGKLYFKVRAPRRANRLNVQIYGDNGDADLYIKVGTAPDLFDFDYSPFWHGL